jgi:hypothetical protein
MWRRARPVELLLRRLLVGSEQFVGRHLRKGGGLDPAGLRQGPFVHLVDFAVLAVVRYFARHLDQAGIPNAGPVCPRHSADTAVRMAEMVVLELSSGSAAIAVCAAQRAAVAQGHKDSGIVFFAHAIPAGRFS